MAEMTDPRRETFRWTTLKKKSAKRHLWLGEITGCGKRDWSTLDIDSGEYNCRSCEAYLSGWLDRHDYGPQVRTAEYVAKINAGLRVPDPTGYGTIRDRVVQP